MQTARGFSQIMALLRHCLRKRSSTVRAPNRYRQVWGGRGGKSRDIRRTIKWDVSWNNQGHNKCTWRLGGRAGSTGARGCRIMSWIRRTRWMTRRRSHVCVPTIRHWNLEGKITTKVAIPREPLKLPVQLLLLSGRETGWLVCDAGLLAGGAGVEPQLKRENAVTIKDNGRGHTWALNRVISN